MKFFALVALTMTVSAAHIKKDVHLAQTKVHSKVHSKASTKAFTKASISAKSKLMAHAR